MKWIRAIGRALAACWRYIGVPEHLREDRAETEAVAESLRARVKYPAGTVIVCPECGAEVATANRDILAGDPKSSAHWDWPDGRPTCGPMRHGEHEPYHRVDDRGLSEIHTREGWIG